MKVDCNKDSVCFYRCNVCGNIMIKLIDSGLTPQCCGRDMEVMTPQSTDASIEKHVPKVVVDKNKICVTVGEVPHPMTDDHYICFVVLKTNKGIYKKSLKPGDEPKVCFILTEGEEMISVYEYCNIHKLWNA